MKMSDPSNEKSPSESAQPFLYVTPSADGSHGTQRASESESGSGQAASAQAIQMAFERGLLEGRAGAQAECEKAAADVRSQVSGAVRRFSTERAEYFGRVEAEVVRLALSIARKILHRESQIDPLVLTGVVHVALQKLNSETHVRLRAYPEEVRFWGEYFKQSKDVFPGVDVVGDPSLAQGHCVLETEFGSTEISLETQLKEIEQGFFDLLEQRPKDAQ
jgi:flagellar assembly protein FliH